MERPISDLKEKRFVVQIFNVDAEQEQPVTNSYAIACPDQQTANMLYELLQRTLQLLTYKPMN